jgi:glycosyltransferase involved in cell wall biosynthesis
MEIKVSTDQLQKHKIFLATPMYGGACSGMFARSVADLAVMCKHYGITLYIYYLFNESLITRARNYCVDEFMRSDADRLLFIDSDIAFDPNDVLAMLALTTQENNPYDVIGAPYPKKNISWEKIKHAVDKGVADEDPNVLENFVGDYVFNLKPGTERVKIDEPCSVLEIGTGFMMIKKATLEKFRDANPQYLYKPDHARSEHFDGSRQITQYFQAEIDPESNRYLSEDYWFCQKIIKMGMEIWYCPWMKTKHVGSYIFGGSLIDIAAIGAAATADEGILQRNKKKRQQK